MASALEIDCVDESLRILGDLGCFSQKLVLKEQQELGVRELLKGNDVLAILPTGFGKSLIYIVFSLAHDYMTRQIECDRRSSVLVISPLKSIIYDQISEVASFNCSAKELSKETLSEISRSPPQFIYCSAESATDKAFLAMLKNDESELHKCVAAIVIDESHTVEAWTGKRYYK